MADTFLTTHVPDLYGSLLANLNKVIFQAYKDYATPYKSVFNIEKALSKGLFEYDTGLAGFGLPSVRSEGSEPASDRIYQGFDKKYTYVVYALLFQYSEESMEADQWGTIAKAGKALGRSMAALMDTLGATIFNNARTDTGPDGQYLVDTDHPFPRGGTQANTLTNQVDIGYGNMQLMLNLVANTLDDDGINYLDFPVKQLIIPPALQWTAREIYPQAGGSIYRPDANAGRGTNVVSQAYQPEIVVWPRITDTDAWFLSAGPENNQLFFKMRRGTRVQHEDKDMSKGMFETMIDAWFDYGYSHYLGIWGSMGA